VNIYINGRFLTQRLTGVQRYAMEIVQTIDRLLQEDNEYCNDKVTLLCPNNICNNISLNKINIKKVGWLHGHLWEQLELPFYARKGVLLNLCNCAPIVKNNQFVTIHDAAIRAFPYSFSWLFRTWYCCMFYFLKYKSKNIFTVSDFSKNELHKYFSFDLNKIIVTYSGIGEIDKCEPDYSIVKRYNLIRGKFVLAVSSINPSKNFRTILNVAQQMPNQMFVIAGGRNSKIFRSQVVSELKNVKFVGYVSDAELVALYRTALCFVFPSLYEGFGLPPIEAMHFGCPAIVSNAASIPEVCRDAVLYCSPKIVSDWVEKIHLISTDDVLKGNLKKRGKEISDRYNFSAPARRILSQMHDK